MQSSIPFAVNADVNGPGSATIPGVPGYVLELHGVYLSAQPTTYSLSSGPAFLEIAGMQGVDGSAQLNATFVPEASACVNLSIPVHGRALGPDPITLMINTGAGQPVNTNIIAWGELVPVGA